VVALLGLCLLASLTAVVLLALRPQEAPPAPTVADFGPLERKLQQLESNLKAEGSRDSKAENKALVERIDALQAKVVELMATVGKPADEVKALGEQLARLEKAVESLPALAAAVRVAPAPLDIKVISKTWGDADPENIQAVCISAAGELWSCFSDRQLDPITVTNSEKGPMVVFGKGTRGERQVLINVNGKFWAQCGYQFAHEFCHILCNYREVRHPNHWFEEMMCETASMFALRRMAKSWAIKAPYPNWNNFSGSLTSYADNLLRSAPGLDGLTLAAWYARNEEKLRANSTNRDLNRVVSIAVLPLLERNPQHWQAVGYLNQWEPREAEQSLAAYLADWHRRVPRQHKPFVQDVARLLEIEVK